jgi:hypothetical protein
MKKILILLAAICLCGCGWKLTKTKEDIPRVNAHMQVVEIEGHEYIVIGPRNNPRIVHAEHCPCKSK